MPRRTLALLILALALTVTAASPALAAGTTADDDCGIVDRAALQAANEAAEARRILSEDAYNSVGKNGYEECLGSLLNPDWGLTLGVPSLKDLLNQACSAARSRISGRISELNQSRNVSVLGGTLRAGGSVGTSGGYSRDRIRVNQTSSSGAIGEVLRSVPR